MASNPPGRCCTIGVLHKGEAKGELKKIGGVDAYFAYPESKKTDLALIILTDVIGHNFINVQLIADQFAANGYFTVIPDLFNGDPIPLNRPPGFDLAAWLKKGSASSDGKGHGPDTVDPIVAKTIEELRSGYGAKKIGAVGYCFGGKYVARFMAQGKGVDVGYTAHPSFVDADEFKGITGPISIAAAEIDSIFPAEKRRLSEDLLKDMSVPYQISLYSGVEHGFSVRGDISKPEIKFAKEAAFFQAVQWFDEYLKGSRESAS